MVMDGWTSLKVCDMVLILVIRHTAYGGRNWEHRCHCNVTDAATAMKGRKCPTLVIIQDRLGQTPLHTQ